MDDVIDRRTRQIYASLADHELVRQLEEARLAAAQRQHGSHAAALRRGRHRALGTRPWVPAVSLGGDELVNADVTASGDQAHVIDLREPAEGATGVNVTAAAGLVGRQRPSEWATDDPSYYLG